MAEEIQRAGVPGIGAAIGEGEQIAGVRSQGNSAALASRSIGVHSGPAISVGSVGPPGRPTRLTATGRRSERIVPDSGKTWWMPPSSSA